jgi:hypothetical protein
VLHDQLGPQVPRPAGDAEAFGRLPALGLAGEAGREVAELDEGGAEVDVGLALSGRLRSTARAIACSRSAIPPVSPLKTRAVPR